MPGGSRQAVSHARLWGANKEGVGGTICQPCLCPLCPLGQCWALKPPSPSAHLNPHDNRSRPYYSSRLAGGYLLPWQPACRKSGNQRGGPGELVCLRKCISRWEKSCGWGKLRQLWCGVGVLGVCVWAGVLLPNTTMRCHTSILQSNSEDRVSARPPGCQYWQCTKLSLLKRFKNGNYGKSLKGSAYVKSF